jgi:DNA helicase-2/ATP-dependent DNA helicase PcrA
MADPLIDDLNPEQRRAVLTVDGPLLVIAGAGSGKTRVLTHRIAHLVRDHDVRASEIIAITFTNKAAGEMADRVGRLLGGRARGMWVLTFHAACARLLRREAERIGYKPGFSIYDSADQVRVVKEVLETDLDKDPKRYPPRGLHARISDAKNRLVGPQEFRAQVNGFFDQTVADVYDRYQARLQQAGAMDFDDLLVNTVRLLEDVPDVREHWTRAFRYVLVDEYQDTNHAQYRIVRALCSKWGNVCVVGDSDQSIYSWRGADVRNMLDFERDFPNAVTVRLERNYRSTQKILDAANAVIEQNRDRQPKRLWSDLGAGEPVRLVEADDERAEARYVVGRIANALDTGHSAEEIAVFYRTNAQSRVLEDALLGADVPYRVIGGTKFYDRAEIKDAMAYLRVIANPADTVSLRRIVNSPRRGIGDTTVSRLIQHAEAMGLTLRDALREAASVLPGAAAKRNVEDFDRLLDDLSEGWQDVTVAELLERVLDRSGYREAQRAERTVEARGRLENLDELVGVAREYDLRSAAGELPGAEGLEGFLQELSLVADADGGPEGADRSMVTLMTIHNAKGLEYPVVFMVGMEEMVFPHVRAIEDNTIEEERRLCYVGMTRAQASLTMVFCRTRMLFGRNESNAPSRFLAEVDEHAVVHERLRPAFAASRPGDRGGPDRGGRQPSRLRDPWAPAPAKPLGVEPKEDLPLLATGDTVRHRAWGEGVVIQVATAEEVVVRFPGQGEKRLHVAYAPIEKV